MAGNGKKQKHLCPKIKPEFSTKVTGPGIQPGMSDADIIKMAKARTRLFADSGIVRQMPRNTFGEGKAKTGKKG